MKVGDQAPLNLLNKTNSMSLQEAIKDAGLKVEGIKSKPKRKRGRPKKKVAEDSG